jgi:hypothetical protein
VRVSADDGTACAASVADGECTLAPTTVGSRTLTATYSGTTEFESSSVSTAHIVEAPTPTATNTSITADDPDPSAVGQAVTVRFLVTAVAGTPAGTVTVTAPGGGSCTATVAQGACDVILVTEGSQTLTAVYAGSPSFAGSSGTESHAVAVPSLSIRRQPSPDADSGRPFRHQPELQLVTADGKPLERSGVIVTASLIPALGSLTGTVARDTDDRGRVKFQDLAIDAPPGVYALHFTADGFTPVTSDSIELR